MFRGRNDLQHVVVARQPRVAAALEALRQAAGDAGIDPRPARMTGSGACVFLPLDSEIDAVTVRNRLQGRTDARILTVRSLARHPLREWAFDGVAASHGVDSSRRFHWGVAKLVKAPDFDSGIRGFESFLPSHLSGVSG